MKKLWAAWLPLLLSCITFVGCGSGSAKSEGGPNFSENSPPTIELLFGNSIELTYGDADIDPSSYVNVFDEEDEVSSLNLDVRIEVGGSEVDSVDTDRPGTYSISLSVFDSGSGSTPLQATAELTVVVKIPEITIVGGDQVFRTPDEGAYTDAGAEVGIESILGTVPAGLAAGDIGEYEVPYQYNYTNADGTAGQVSATRYVFITPLVIDLKVLTRVEGVSPETVYFSAQDSRPVDAADCVDFNGNTGNSDPDVLIACSTGQYFGYHFNFDDPDSGNFTFSDNPVAGDTPHSKNEQISAAPRAIHTFVCEGAGNSRWNGVDACEYQVGVRVQEPDGDFADAYVDIRIEPQDVAYSAGNTFCIANNSDFSECPAGVPAQNQLTDTPSMGDFSGARILYKRRTEVTDTTVYADACIGYEESGATLDAYGSGSFDPVLDRVVIGVVSANCGDVIPTTAEANSYPTLSKDIGGYVSQGWAYDVTITNLRLGSARVGMAATLVTMHNLDLDWSSDDSNNGEVRMATASDLCERAGYEYIDCSAVQYPYGIFVSEANLKGNSSNLSGINLGCLNGCGLINSGIVGVDVKSADQHNLRVMGSWGLVISNSWIRGGHLGGEPGGKTRITLRYQSRGSLASQTANPEDFVSGNHNGDGPGFYRVNSSSFDFAPSYNFVVDSWIDDVTQDPLHLSAPFVQLESGLQFSGTFGLKFYYDGDNSDNNINQLFLGGRNIVALDTEFNGENIECRVDRDNDHNDSSFYYDSDTIWGVGASDGNCQSGRGALTLPPAPSAPGS